MKWESQQGRAAVQAALLEPRPFLRGSNPIPAEMQLLSAPGPRPVSGDPEM